jgi:hypothetical protein
MVDDPDPQRPADSRRRDHLRFEGLDEIAA